MAEKKLPAISDRVHPVPSICVFAPWLIFTVTIETVGTGDDEIYIHAGGQGFWVARMIKSLGLQPILCGPVGGETGIVLEALIHAEGIEFEGTSCQRWNGGYIHDRRSGKRQKIAEMACPGLNRHEYDNLYDSVLTLGMQSGTVVLTGIINEDILPNDMYRRLALDLGDNGVSVIADLSTNAIKTLSGGIDFLKVSHNTLIEAGYSRDEDESSIWEGLLSLKSTGSRNIIVSRAEEPSLVLLGDRMLKIKAPHFNPMDHRGAGDSMTAALAVARAEGLENEEALRLATAAGALNVTRHGLGTGNRKSIEEIGKHVEIKEMGLGEN